MKDTKTDMAKDELYGFCFTPVLRFGNESTSIKNPGWDSQQCLAADFQKPHTSIGKIMKGMPFWYSLLWMEKTV